MSYITLEALSKMEQGFAAFPAAAVASNAVMNQGVNAVAKDPKVERSLPHDFSIRLEQGEITNQKRSGRCWMFAALNTMRFKIMKDLDLDTFELSQSYTLFYDKLEKCNWFMNCVIAESDKPLDDRTMQWLLDNGISEGGQWDMAVSLIRKYGICPKEAMLETYASSHTARMNGLLNQRLRRFALDVRKAGSPDEIEQLRKAALEECYRLIADCFGMPPVSFTFEYRDTKKKHHAIQDVTPLEFYEKYLGEDLNEYAVLINAPTEDKPYHKMYTVKYIGNVVSGNEIRYLNLPIKEFKDAIIRQLKAGTPVWFGCDCGKDGNRTTGLWDDQAYDYAHTFRMNLDLSKAEMLDSRHSAMNHAMVFTGVNLVNGKPTRWKIENSWGDEKANKGYYICSDTWFDKYVYEVSVKKEYLTAKQRKELGGRVKVLEPWDPFGTLAD